MATSRNSNILKNVLRKRVEQQQANKKMMYQRQKSMLDRRLKTLESNIHEVKSAPKGYHFTKDGKLRKGDADVDGDGGKKLRSDPLDKQRNKIPPLPEAYGSVKQTIGTKDTKVVVPSMSQKEKQFNKKQSNKKFRQQTKVTVHNIGEVSKSDLNKYQENNSEIKMSNNLIDLASSSISKMVKKGHFNKNDNMNEANNDEVKVTKVPENKAHTAKMKKAAKMYTTSTAHQRGRGTGSPGTYKEENDNDQDVDFTVIDHKSVQINLPEELTYNDFLNAAKIMIEGNEELVNEEVSIADKFFEDEDISLILESEMKSEVQKMINKHKDAGHKISDVSFTSKEGKPHAQFVKTHKETGVKTRHTFMGNVNNRKHENLGDGTTTDSSEYYKKKT